MEREPVKCSRFECQEWVNGDPVRPVLVHRGPPGHWYCPKCNCSYGEHAQEPFDPSIYDEVE